MHGVGEGEPWIASQIDHRFGELSRYLLDFYHACEYLANASRVCALDAPKAWMDQQISLFESLTLFLISWQLLESPIDIFSIVLII